MNDIEFLKAVREKLSDESRWGKRHHAVDDRGALTWPESSDAVNWCLLGAADCVLIARKGSTKSDRERPVDWGGQGAFRLADLLYGSNIGSIARTAAWNDDPKRTHAEVMERLDTAIAMLATAEAVKKASAPGPSIKDETEALDDEIQRVRHLAGLA